MILSSILSGCSIFKSFKTFDTSEEIGTDDALVCKVPYDFNYPTPINMRDVTFYVLTPEKMRELINENPDDLPIVYYGLSVDGYKSMSFNIQDINRFLEENKVLFTELKKYYSDEGNEKAKKSSEKSE